MTLADDIRAYTYERVVAPQLARARVASVNAWDVHQGLNYADRVPAVCAALRAHIFAEQYGLILLEERERPVSSRTTFVFMAAEDAIGPGQAAMVPAGHQEALEWFVVNAGRTVRWSDLRARELAAAPKGIYRPAGRRHALSVKVMPGGPYPDELPAAPPIGAVFRYHQEEAGERDPRQERSNIGLANCMRDRVGVGIIRRINQVTDPEYEVLGLGQVLDWRDGFFHIRLGVLGADGAEDEGIGPISEEDARRRALRAIVQRRGQARFRRSLLRAYSGRCAISGCDTVEVLEAAHIRPYLGAHTDVVQNGLLLRADLHTLFDLGALRIDPQTRRVVLDAHLRRGDYAGLHDRCIATTTDPAEAPTAASLEYAWQISTPDLDG